MGAPKREKGERDKPVLHTCGTQPPARREGKWLKISTILVAHLFLFAKKRKTTFVRGKRGGGVLLLFGKDYKRMGVGGLGRGESRDGGN